MQYFGRSTVEGNYTKNPIFPDDEGSQKGEQRRLKVGPPQAGAAHGLAAPPCGVGAPQPFSPPFLRVLLRPENLSHRGYIAKSHSRLCGRRTPERKELSGRNPPGKFPPEGEIDAIAIVIELDIIPIAITIISIIYTAISTAAPRHRCNDLDKTLLDTTCSGSFTSNKEEFKRDLLDRIKENAEDWENDKGKESGYADKPPFKPLPPKEGSKEREVEKKKKKGTKKKKKKKKKKKENKKKEVTAYPRVNEITLGNRKYVAPNDYCDNESEYDDLPMPFTYISDHDLNEHTTFDITNLWETNSENDNNFHSVSAIHASSHNDIESSKLGEEVFENPFATGHYVLDTSPSNNNDGSFQGSREEDDILRSRRMKSLSLGMPRWFIPAYFKKTQASKLGDAQGIPFFIDKVSGSFS
ncbi:hypothetical protein QYE76_032115 [Lolium multiflorum]|uniref:Uncharacterized protein n=1 Tax=Lolium multiflorum TaxID=4521 RepID=A0AAD8QV67_LOLMU|nr:hypothetical protein QYE76_032115 [Lolium multiflorum]